MIVVRIDFHAKSKKSSKLEGKQITLTSTEIAMIGRKYLKNNTMTESPFKSKVERLMSFGCIVFFDDFYFLRLYIFSSKKQVALLENFKIPRECTEHKPFPYININAYFLLQILFKKIK